MALSFSVLLTSACYTTRQGWHQLGLLASRQPIEDVLENPETRPALREALSRVEPIRRFASDQGLEVGHAYSTVVDPPGGEISWTVAAAWPDRLESKTWWFPVVGTVPYLGFFRPEDRDREKERLIAEGFDVSLGTVGAFSSLGWFSDPIYTPMLRRKPLDLARLLFHELTHRSLWISNQASFNEALAEFLSLKLTRAFAKTRPPEELARFEEHLEDERAFEEWLNLLSKDLSKLYKAHRSSPIGDLALHKAEIFKRYTASPPERLTARWRGLFLQEWNNATVLAHRLYRADLSEFEAAWERQKPASAGDFLTALRQAIKDAKGEPFGALKRLASKAP
jgi:predicted aminopeptidase